jgi:hypothetical protein
VTNGTPLTQGSATATLDVVNATLPDLTVSFANPVVTQNQTDATVGTVSIVNGSAPTSPITVTLGSNDPNSATVPTTVIIPAGQTSATFTITTPADSQHLGTVLPDISASAAGLGPATKQLIVTDTNDPNTVVSKVQAPDPGNNQTFTITYTVTNQGTATAVGPWQDALYITTQPTGGTLVPLIIDQPGTPTNTIDYNGDLLPGQSYSRTLTVFAPEATGSYWVVVQTDSDLQLEEATNGNEETETPAPVSVVPSYKATVQADLAVNQAGQPVPLSGTATNQDGSPAVDQVVDIYIFDGMTQQAISAITDANGLFSAEFQPLPGEAGILGVGAANPGVDPSQVTAQATFDIIGMGAPAPTTPLSLIEDAPATGGQVTITNLASDIALTDLTASVQGAPSNVDVSVTLGNGSSGQGLAAGGTIGLTYSATASGTSTPSGTFTIVVTSAEGATVDIPVGFNVIADVPDVVASPSSLQAGMIIGSQTIVQLTLNNDGGAASGPLQVLLPTQPAGEDFLTLATSSTIDSIPIGGSAQVTLLLTPPAGMALGTYAGSIVVQGASGSTTIPFSFINQSSATGNLDVTTVDEYTFFAPGAPNLAGAAITVTNELTNQVVATGTTNSDGQLDLSNLPVGDYQITATASGNSPYNGTAVINAGQTTQVDAFLPLQLVTTTFTVTPTSVQDNIQVQVNTTFESNVPAPVITASPMTFDVGPLTADGDSEQIDLTIANHGLVAAVNMQLYFGTHPYYTFTPLITDIGTLPADSSLTVPVLITRVSTDNTGNIPCSVPADLSWDINTVGPNASIVPGFLAQQIAYTMPLYVINIPGDCAAGAGLGGGLIGGEVPPGEPGTVVFEPIATSYESDCNACQTATDAALLQYSTFPDWESAGAGLGSALAGGATNVMADASSFLSALVAYLQATPDAGEAVSLIDTTDAAVTACADNNGGNDTSSVVAARDALQGFANGFQSLVDETDEIFGNSDWINPYSSIDLTKWLTAFAADAAGGAAITSSEASALESMTLPEEVSLTDVQNFIARWNQTITYNAEGVYDSTQVPSGGTTNFIARDIWSTDLLNTDAAYAQVTAIGSTSFSAAILYEMQQLLTDTSVSTPLGGICTQVQLQLDQTVVVTRSAFNATLSIQNDKTDPITDIGVTITVTNAQGQNVTNLFDIESPNLTGLTAVDGTGTLAAGATGSAVFTLIPTNAAAPTTATDYYVSAQLTYQVDGMNLAIPFTPQTITVQPSPSLTIRYFEQSAVYAADPYGSDTEPSEPFALGVQVVNVGAGAANNVSITSAQPQIVNSLSGLLASFQLVATQVDGQNLTPSLTVDLGNIAPGGLATALFLMTSSIDGQFVSYNATFQDENGLGSSQLSIVNSVVVYNLIHLASEIGPDASTGSAFLVSDIPGASSPPDAVFLPDGSVDPVAQATDVNVGNETVANGQLSVTMTDTPTSGWSYLDIPDPGDGAYRLVSVTRSDGVELPVNDFWQTDQTYVSDGQPPILENDLHILDDNSTGTYTLTYVPINQLQPEITNVSAVTPNPALSPVNSLQVTFNEPIAIGTLDANVMDLSLDGGPNLIGTSSDITVSLVSGSTYEISGLSALDTANGTYTFTINAAGVEDPYGNPGAGQGSTVWEMAENAPAVASIAPVTPGPRNTPVSSVTVTFTEPVDASSFGLSALSLTDDGGPNLITSSSGVTITQEGPSTFEVSGLSGLTSADGNYVLTVDATQVTSDGTPGIGSDSVSWTMDTVPPLVSSFSTVASPRNTPADDIDVTFSKPINPASFTDSALSLTLGGGSNLINSGVTITQISDTTYEISGLAALDKANGSYSLTVNGTDISDLAGNVGTNSLSTTWVMETTVPAAPSDLAISPNTGTQPGVTNTGTLILTGSLPETGMTVDVFDASTNTNLGQATVSGTTFSMPLNLIAGTTTLNVTDEDAAGNVSPAATFTIFVDQTPPTVASFAPVSPNPTNTAVGSVDVTFSKPINSATFTAADLSLTDNGGAIPITSAVTISLVSGSTYQIGGLAGLTTAEGTYVLTVNAAGVQDTSGNMGVGSLSTSWLMDTTPPTSSVSPLPATTTSDSVLISVTGTDPVGSNGSTPSGIASFAIYVSKDGGAFSLFATVTPTSPSALFTGQAGNTYGFYSIATDNAGNLQPTPTAAQATIQFLTGLNVSSITAVSPNPRNTSVSTVDVTFSETINTSAVAPGAVTLTDDGNTVSVSGVTLSLVSGTTYAINGLSSLTAAQGNYVLTVNTSYIEDSNGNVGAGSLSTSWLMDTTAPTSHVVNNLGTTQTTDTFPVQVTFTDPGSASAPASGVSAVSLYVSVNNGPFSLYQTIDLTTPETSGTVTFTFDGQDRNLYAFHSIAEDAAGNIESKSSVAIEASTAVPDLNPPVTHVLSSNPSYSWSPFPSSEFNGLTASSYNSSTGVFTINWAGADPDAHTGTPPGSIALVDIYVEIDGSPPTLIGQLNGGTPNSSGVYTGSMTYNALADGQPHTYSFYSIGIDDEQKAQVGPATPDATFSDITYSAPLAVQSLTVEKGIAERSYIRYLDVDFNETVTTSTALQSLQAGLSGSSPNSYVELLWYGENLNSTSTPQGSVNLFNTGTTASVSLSGNDLSINFGPNGITSLLTETGVSGTGSPSTSFGDGWYALGIDATGNPSTGPTYWVTFFRLLGSATGDTTVSGPYTAAGTDAYVVYHAMGESGQLLDADVNGDGSVNSKDLIETAEAYGHTVGTTAPSQFPTFQLFAGATSPPPAAATAITQGQVKALLPAAIDAWRAAGLDAAEVQLLENVQIQVGNLGTSILGLETAGVITINQTAAGYNWYVGTSPVSADTLAVAGPGGEKIARPDSPAAGDVDLLTVLEHELGHVLGLQDNAQAGDLMDTTLGLGVERAPTSADVSAIAPVATSVVATVSPTTSPAAHPQQSLVTSSITQATVDAALVSIIGTTGSDGDGPDPTGKRGAAARPMSRHPGIVATSRKDDQKSPFTAPFRRRVLSSLFTSKLRHAGQSSGPASDAS